MGTLTIFFNSDGDITVTDENTISGRDGIATSSKLHLMTALATQAANFMNSKFYLYGSAYSKATQTVDVDGNLIINGPGSGHFLSDDLFTRSSGFFQWSPMTFVNRWSNNIYRAIEYIRKDNTNWIYKKERPPEGISDDSIPAITDLPKDWLLREFRIVENEYVKISIAPYTQINLVGWGRGGVSCHMFANAMKTDSRLCSIPVNILAIDPVVGPLTHEPGQTTLADNVSEYVGFYARDERSASLPCIVPDTAPNTRIHIYPIAGRHTTLIGNQATDGDSSPGTFSEPSDLVFYLAMKCLNRWDSDLSIKAASGYPDLSETGNSVLAKIKSEYDNYITMRHTTYLNQSQEIKNDREIWLNGQLTNFKSAQGARFTPSQGLAKGHIEDMSYFNEII
ncbi:hypothetical protein [Pseudomonas sp. L1(2025)]|uniref:hypothetical protein n=1 Tax=Pseudomonas sp. L1(2025) TaxID=3449429 RepID=UPI003F68DCC0